jgi:hypothetical protein
LQRWLMPLSKPSATLSPNWRKPAGLSGGGLWRGFRGESPPFEGIRATAGNRRGRYGLQPGLEANLNKGGYAFTFPGQQEPGTIVFRIGDLRHELRVEPVLRPAAEGVRAIVSAPEYLGIPERAVDLNTGVSARWRAAACGSNWK